MATIMASTSRIAIKTTTTRTCLSGRALSTTPCIHARQQFANKPKRDATLYGISNRDAPSIPKDQWPNKQDTNTDNHPLWKFFHDQQSLEAPDKRTDESGRAWTSFELRRKSFEDLHSLWYIVLRERNVLLTQREEARRLRLDLQSFGNHSDRLRMCQKSMARIKQVVSERRHAALEAAEILRSRGDIEGANKMEQQGRQMQDIESQA
ncbi:54S ribosomal protein L4 mitochondrial [Microbotryomycetes sp. JL221]|nr:54S ribosomal protein L4 mitochondrial [Microbotryomycetes sp. JL221]